MQDADGLMSLASGGSMISEADIFNPNLYDAVRKPLLEAETMPAWCYTSRAFYDREIERIWKKVWNFLGSADRIPKIGDYFTVTFAGIPLIVLRETPSCRARSRVVGTGEPGFKRLLRISVRNCATTCDCRVAS